MKILIVSDIHSNYRALDTVMEHSKPHTVDLRICLGDMVGYYDSPNEVINRLRKENFICIKGNHDKYILDEINYNPLNKDIYGIERHRLTISNENYLFLKACKDEYYLYENNINIHFCHTMANDYNVYLKEKSDFLNYNNELFKDDFFIFGHTHLIMNDKVGNTRVINPGSVGQPRKGCGQPSYCILDTLSGICEHYKASYDVESYGEYLINHGYDHRLIDILLRKS